MNLTIGSTTIEITSCVRKRDTQKGFFLDLTIPRENIGMDELYALLNGNTEDIIVDENVYKGFKEVGSFALENGTYRVAQVCTSELEAQLSLAQNTIKEQNVTISTMQNTLNAQETALKGHTKIISEQTKAITLQTETIKAQTEEIAILNDTLLEVLMA